MNHRFHRTSLAWVILTALLLSLIGCDPGGRLTQLTPQAPAATPMVLGITEVPTDATSTGGLPGSIAPGETPLTAPTPPPTATYDAAKPAWTIFYYAGTDNGRAGYVWNDLNEMEAGFPSDQVRVIAQVDWPEGGPAGTSETVRYLVRPDEDGSQLTSEVVGTQAEVNGGDPLNLADFLTWAIATYPANRYALILGDFGGGWRGCCFDEVVGVPDQSDHLTLSDLDQALAVTQSQTGGLRFDTIAFAAGLMNQIDVLQVIQPYADYGVASPGLVPGSSWDFQAVIAQLSADPLVDKRQFAGDLVTAYVNSQRQLEGNEFVSMAAVDLKTIPALTSAVEALALALESDSGLHGAIAADARRGAQHYGAASLRDSETIAAVDLLHVAAIMAEIAPPGELSSAATSVASAVTNALVAYDHGLGIPNGRGIAIYWPGSTSALDPAYGATSHLPNWAGHLAGSAPAPAYPTHVKLDRGPRDTVNIASPALMRAVIAGHRLAEVALVSDQVATDGRHVLRQYEIIQPAAVTYPGGTNANLWKDGQHESLIIWDATATYLADAAGTGDFVPLRPVDQSPAGSQLTAVGQFQRAEGDKAVDTTVTFTSSGPASKHLWASVEASDGMRLVGEIAPAQGDVFHSSVIFIGESGIMTAERGVSLTFDDSAAIYRSARALPTGSYNLGMRAVSLESVPVMASQPLTIDPAGVGEGFRAYVNAVQDVQFLYPSGWLPPVTQEAVTYTSNISNTTQMQVRYYPGWTGDLATLQNEVLGTFGEISILQNEPVSIGADLLEGILTAYGYESAETNPRTGVFLTFMKDGMGYVVDIDGPRDEEATTLSYINTIASTWQFLPERLGFGPELWEFLNVGEYRMAFPSYLAYQDFNSWHRFAADSQTFAAARIQPAVRTPSEAMAGLLQTAAEGVNDFTADEPQRLFYGGYLWERNDFSYTDVNGSIVKGLLLSRQDSGMEIAVWAEVPDPPGEMVETLFLPIAASIERIPVPPSG